MEGPSTLPSPSTIPSPSDMSDVNVSTGGRLQYFLSFWETMTNDIFVLDMIKGVHIPFDTEIVQNYVPSNIKCPPDEMLKIDKVIESFVASSIIEEVNHCTNEYISTIFPVVKKNKEDIRIILNLKSLNPSVTYEHFKMEHLSSALNLVEENCYMASIDLKDAYYSVNVDVSSRKFLKFFWNNRLYQFTCLAQGLSCAPRMFTKIMKPLYAHLRSRGFLSTYYLDDSLLFGKTFSSCSKNIEATKQILENAGFVINCRKSFFVPSNEIEYLGFVINSSKMTVTLPLRKKNLILKLCNNIQSKNCFVIRDIASFIGNLVASLPGVLYGALYYRFLEKCKIDALRSSRGDFDSTMTLSDDARKEVHWWSKNILSSFKPINVSPPSVVIQTDASLSGWGCVHNSTTTGGPWSPKESTLHINILELKAVYFGLLSFFSSTNGTHIRIQSDNSTTVAYINNMGGVKSLDCHAVALDIWKWAAQRNIYVSAEHLPGSLNTLADNASRIFDVNTEWQLAPNYFDKIRHYFGSCDIDLFASRLNSHCSVYCSWKPDPNANYVDAFTVNWNKFSNPYIFPPFSVIGKCLQKICADRAKAIFVAPLWPTQPWYPKLMSMLTAVPLVLPEGVLKLPFKPNLVHKQHKTLRLIACHLSGNYLLHEEFLRTLSKSSAHPGEIPPNLSIQFMLNNGFVSVADEKLIPFNSVK